MGDRPEPVRMDHGKLRQGCSSPDAQGGSGPSDIRRALSAHLKQVLVPLGNVALQALVHKYVPEVGVRGSRLSSSITNVTDVLLMAASSAEALDMLRLEGAAFVGALCHFLEVRLRKMQALRRLPRPELRALLAQFGVVAPGASTMRQLVSMLTALASHNRRSRETIVRTLADAEGGVHSVSAAVGYLDECPEIVQGAIMSKTRKRARVE